VNLDLVGAGAMTGTSTHHTQRAEKSDLPVIDLSYLHQQSYGNIALETEILELFLRQSCRLLAGLNEGFKEEQYREYARALKGSAYSVGALQVAHVAAQLEAEFYEKNSSSVRRILHSLESAILRVNELIRQHLKITTASAH
jgi:HPt (histidine-containing phosphotransfer) domain-containing protein